MNNGAPTLDYILEQYFSSEFNERWDKLIKPEETTPENRDINFDLILSLVEDLAPRGPDIIKTFCEPTVDEKPLMFWFVRRLLLEQVLFSLDNLFGNLRRNGDITEEEWQAESSWLIEKGRLLSLEMQKAENIISIHQLSRTDIQEL